MLFKKRKAFTMIEVLVAMLVLAIGLLGLAGMTVVVLRSNVLSQQISEATTITSDLMERLKRVPFTQLPDSTACPAPTYSTPCPILEESGIMGRPEIHPGTAAGCVIPGVLFNDDQVWDVTTARLQSEAPPAGAFCSAFNALPSGRYIRYYRTQDVGTERQITVVVVWKDRFNKWRRIDLSANRVN